MFDSNFLKRRYSFLDECPEQLLDAVASMPAGMVRDRVAGIRAWRDALLDGRLPPEPCWPPGGAGASVRQALASMGIQRFCKGEPGLVDDILRDVIASVVAREAATRAEVAARLAELARIEHRRMEVLERVRADRAKRLARQVALGERQLAALRKRAEAGVASHLPRPDARLIAVWGERARAWAEIHDVFGDLGEMLGRGWDLSLAVLRHAGWTDVLRLRKMIEGLPELKEVCRALGRLQASKRETSVAEQVFVPMRRLEQEMRSSVVPGVPPEMRGVERSGELARMLPVEVLMLGHPILCKLWHARRAERALLTYRVQGVVAERAWTETTSQQAAERKAPRPERGPIIAVIDTSGSMHGLPERVAKALVLEAVRVAHAERRRCYMYAFSGPGEVLEHELDLSPEGLGALLPFLAMSFQGGTDLRVLDRVVHRLQEQAWCKADVLLVTDGEWPVSQPVAAAGREAKARGTRFHGVLVGREQSQGLRSICDAVHVFHDWASAGGRAY